MRNLIAALSLASLLMSSGLAAETPAAASPVVEMPVETLFVRARPLVPLLSAPTAEATAVRELTPGDRLTVLGRQAGFVNVRTADNTQGWLRETDLTGAAPPGVRVAELTQETARLREELTATRGSLETAQSRLRQARQAAAAARESGADQSAALEAETLELREKLAASNAETERLRDEIAGLEMARLMRQEAAELLATQPAPDTAFAVSRFSRVELAMATVAALGLVLLGTWLGTTVARRRLRRRYHGMEL